MCLEKIAEFVIRRYVLQEESLIPQRVKFIIARNGIILAKGIAENNTNDICEKIRAAKIHFPTDEEIEEIRRKEEEKYRERRKAQLGVRKKNKPKLLDIIDNLDIDNKLNLVEEPKPKTKSKSVSKSISKIAKERGWEKLPDSVGRRMFPK